MGKRRLVRHFSSSCITVYKDGREPHYTSGRSKSFSASSKTNFATPFNFHFLAPYFFDRLLTRLDEPEEEQLETSVADLGHQGKPLRRKDNNR